MILAGDVGGTKTALALFERGGDGLVSHAQAVLPSAEFGSLDEVLKRFLADHPGVRIESAGFGVAGAVVDGRARTTNLPWAEVSEAALARGLGAPVKLLNDLEAAAYGMLALPESDLVTLQPGAAGASPGNMAVIAAGTGLGEALLVWDGVRHRAVATEGGHVDLAPRTDEEIELLRFLRAEQRGRVSVERAVSGPGLLAVYRFARATQGEPEPAWLSGRLEAEGGGAVSACGLDGSDAACVRALGLFVSLYGAEAGNLALKCLAVGGVFVGGGIAPSILPALEGGAFLDAFADKGRFEPLLRSIPVRVCTHPGAPLIGAARSAAAQL